MPPTMMRTAPDAAVATKPNPLDTSLATSSPGVQPKRFWELLTISIGFLGIQFAWAIQMGQMSPLLERLGSAPWLTSILWCAGPITGIVVQPIVGSWSDRTWTRLGRRRPFLLAGAILTALSLIAMPNSPNLIVAAALLWVLDASINISQGPYRSLVPDTVPKSQQALTYSLMSFTIGLGSVIAFFISGTIGNMHSLFYLGAVAMLAAMAITIITTPETKELASDEEPQSQGFGAFIQQTWQSIVEMPSEMKKLCMMHSFTWFGWQCLFIFFALFVPHQVFGVTDPNSPLYAKAGQWTGYCYLALNSACFIVSPFIGKLSQAFSRKAVHTFGLLCFAAGLISTFFLTTPLQALIAMSIIGIGWATTLSIPFAILAAQAPSGKAGVLMGTFNIFVAAPQFVASALAGFVVSQTHSDASALVLGGISVLFSAFLLQWVRDNES